ncbi:MULTISPECIES: phage integrase family protein [Burkholderia cepacia complex]|uniref:phage integrase family protein n=1 Tax=Burkholderia cepacia complex TaxID=87882 RepID=UPI0012BAEB43
MRNNVHGGALREIRARIALHTRSRARRAASLVETSQPEHARGLVRPQLIARLTAADVATCADLLTLIRKRRQRWYRAALYFGPPGAHLANHGP